VVKFENGVLTITLRAWGDPLTDIVFKNASGIHIDVNNASLVFLDLRSSPNLV
jgi:hypothetical protein